MIPQTDNNDKSIHITLAEDETTHPVLLSLLKEYQSIILSCVGPNGRSKLLARSINNSAADFTSSSALITNVIYDINNILKNFDNDTRKAAKFGFIKWKFELIRSVIKNAHFDHHYDSGLWLLYLVNEFQIRAPSFQLNRLNNQVAIDLLITVLYKHLDESRSNEGSLISTGTDLSVTFLRKIVGSTLQSKCIVQQMSAQEKDSFVNLCLKAFITSFQEDQINSSHFSDILFLYNEDFSSHLSNSELVNGVLFQIDCTQSFRGIQQSSVLKKSTGFKCVLFDASFGGDFEMLQKRDFQMEINSQAFNETRSVFLIVEQMKKLCGHLIEKFGIDVVLSQKVVHPSIKSYLMKKNVLCIDRLSIHLTKFISDLTGCQVCNSAWNLNQFDTSSFGRLSDISLRHIKGKDYIHFENQTDNVTTFPVQTMLICVQNETLSAEIQNLMKVAQYTFQRAILTGRVFCGGPCFYTYSLCYLWKFLYQEFKVSAFTASATESRHQASVNKAKVFELLKVLKHIFINFARCLLDYSFVEYDIDLTNGHLFHMNKTRCNCGYIQLDRTKTLSACSKINIFEETNFNLIDFEAVLEYKISGKGSLELMECCESKLNALRTTLEIVVSILQVGVFIHD